MTRLLFEMEYCNNMLNEGTHELSIRRIDKSLLLWLADVCVVTALSISLFSLLRASENCYLYWVVSILFSIIRLSVRSRTVIAGSGTTFFLFLLKTNLSKSLCLLFAIMVFN